MSRSVTACIAPQLFMSILLGMLFLSKNDIVLSCKDWSAIDWASGFDWMNPTPRPDSSRDMTAGGPASCKKTAAAKLVSDRKALPKQLKSLPLLEARCKDSVNSVGAVQMS